MRGGPAAAPRPLVPLKLLHQLRLHAEGAGLNLFGIVDRARFDACEPRESRVDAVAPACGTVIVLGSGGRGLAERHATVRVRGGIDATVAHVVDHFAATLSTCGIPAMAVRFDAGSRIRGDRLAEAAGLGIVSPVSGFLLHPEFGPWVRVRAAILCAGQPFGAIAEASLVDRFQPCNGCARPCVGACPAHGRAAPQEPELAACAGHRHLGGCADECARRMACPVGAEHCDCGDDHVHRHGHDLGTLRRWFGLGVWRYVPKALRGGP
jgi:hypothetical protein